MTPNRLPFRIGHGYDLHPLQPGGRLILGSIAVSTEISPIAHSDGDVILHALVDALLGAMAWGDIGELFPNNDDRWKWRRAASSSTPFSRGLKKPVTGSPMSTSWFWRMPQIKNLQTRDPKSRRRPPRYE